MASIPDAAAVKASAVIPSPGRESLAIPAVCPFCAAINATFAEQIGKHEISVIAKLIHVPPVSDEIETEFPKAKFEILQVVKGDEFVAAGMTFQTQLVGTYPLGEKFLVMGVEPPSVFWSTPMQTTDRVIKYLLEIQALPAKGPDRLAFFQEYFENEESVLAFDAYDEYAVADYADLIAMKDRIKKDKLIKWIHDPEIRVDRRRLYFTMLGVCGNEKDIAMLEGLIKADDPQQRAGLDALIAAYLTLKGEAGVALIEDVFLKSPDVDDPETNAAISALRFHGTEVNHIPRARIAQAVRLVLDHPKLADTVIPDLARWEDWSVIERMVELFKNCDEDYQYVRVPVVAYLHACPKPEAKQYLKELEEIDPDAIRRAKFFMGDYIDDDEINEDEADAGQNTNDDPKKNEPLDSVDANPTDADSDIKLVTTITMDNAASAPSTSIDDERPRSFGETAHRTLSGSRELVLAVTSSLQTSALVVEEFDEVDKAIDAELAAESDPDPEFSEIGSDPTESEYDSPSQMPISSEKTETSNVAANRNEGKDVTNNAANPSTVTDAVPVAVISGRSVTWLIIFIPAGFSLLIFILIWSVVNGWFERLIF